MRLKTGFALFLLTSAIVALAISCSVLIDVEECVEDSECPGACDRPMTCVGGVCEPIDRAFVGGQCQQTFGDVEAPNAFVVGVLLPLTGDEAGFGLPLLNAIELAWEDFDGLGGTDGRPLAFLVCDTEGLDEVALEAGRHLVEEAKVQAIIGPDFSSQTVDVAQQHAIPNDVLMVTPSGTAAAITGLDDRDLVWRTAPSDEAQAEAIARLAERIVTDDLGLELGEATVWILSRQDDLYGNGLRTGLVETLSSDLTSSESFITKTYPENWADNWYTETAQQLATPDVVLLMGAAESWDIAEQIDEERPNDPIFIFADAAKNAEEAGKTAGERPELEGRVFGTAPQNVGDVDYTPYTNFRVKYQSRFDEDPNESQFVANAYDAAYLVALAAAAGGFCGPELADGMKKLSEGTNVSANQTGASEAMSVLNDGETVDFEGASGRLDFDDEGNPSPAAISLWCFEKGGVPEKGKLLTIQGEFTDVSCDDEGTNNANNGNGDMGADMGGADMGGADTGGGSDM